MPRLPTTEDEILEYLLGSPAGEVVTVNDAKYVLPLGVDPYWEDFGACYGYELLPEDERPVQVGPTHELWQPGKPRPGFVEGKRSRWTGLPQAQPGEPVLPWQALGDLRRCVRWAAAEPQHLLNAPQPSTSADYLVSILRSAALLHDEIVVSREHWPDSHEPDDEQDERMGVTASIFTQLDELQDALAGLLETVRFHADEAQALEARSAFLGRLNVSGAAGPPPGPYSRPSRGRHPQALLVVHAAKHYFRVDEAVRERLGLPETAPDDDGLPHPRVIAMVVALEPAAAAAFSSGGKFLAGTSAERQRAIGYWRDRIRDYRDEPKSA